MLMKKAGFLGENLDAVPSWRSECPQRTATRFRHTAFEVETVSWNDRTVTEPR